MNNFLDIIFLLTIYQENPTIYEEISFEEFVAETEVELAAG